MMRSAWLAALSLLATAVHAHTWIDCLDTDRSKIYDQSASYIFGGEGGNGFCEGYGAGYPGRGDTSIGTEYTYKMLLNEVEAGATVCQAVAADTYSGWRTRMSVAPGTTIYYAYLPNGHIVKDKKGIGTQHGVYWTGVPGTSLTTTNDMTTANLINGATLDYDDGNCGETYDYEGNPGGRAGDGWPCIGSFSIPAGTAAGVYNMVWYWTFYLPDGSYVDQSQAKGYFGAAYSTCFQVEVTGGGSAAATTAPAATTAAPVATTAAPVATTAAPVATTAAPVVTTAAPVATTAAPAATAAPEVTAAAPAATAADTAAAAATTAPASETTSSSSSADTPVATTATPAATTESRSLDFTTLGGSSSNDAGTVHAASGSSSSTGSSEATVGSKATSSATTTDSSASSSQNDQVSVLTESDSASRLAGGGVWLSTLVAAATATACLLW